MSYGKLSRVWWKGDVVYMLQLVALLHLRMVSNEWQNQTIMNEGLWNRCALHPFTFCNGCHIINHHFRGTCEGTCLRKGKEKLTWMWRERKKWRLPSMWVMDCHAVNEVTPKCHKILHIQWNIMLLLGTAFLLFQSMRRYGGHHIDI